MSQIQRKLYELLVCAEGSLVARFTVNRYYYSNVFYGDGLCEMDRNVTDLCTIITRQAYRSICRYLRTHTPISTPSPTNPHSPETPCSNIPATSRVHINATWQSCRQWYWGVGYNHCCRSCVADDEDVNKDARTPRAQSICKMILHGRQKRVSYNEW